MKNQKNYFGRTDNLTPVIISNIKGQDVGKIINVKVKGYNRNTLFAVKENMEREVAA